MNRLSGKIFWEGEGGKETTFIQPCFNNLFTTHTNMIREWIKWVRVRENNRLQKKNFNTLFRSIIELQLKWLDFEAGIGFGNIEGQFKIFVENRWNSIFTKNSERKKFCPYKKFSPPIKRRVLFFFFSEKRRERRKRMRKLMTREKINSTHTDTQTGIHTFYLLTFFFLLLCTTSFSTFRRVLYGRISVRMCD